MRRPKDIRFDDRDTRELKQIEDYIDSKLSAAELLGHWPVEIVLCLSRWRPKNVFAVFDKYRKAGWILKITAVTMRDYTYTIDHPAR